MEQAEQMEFKAGDKVRITKIVERKLEQDFSKPTFSEVGDIFTINEVIHWYSSKIHSRLCEYGTREWLLGSELELVEQQQESQEPQQPPQALQATTAGIKHDSGKVWPSQLYVELNSPLIEISKVLTYGAKKYSRTNWKLVEPERYQDAMLRHMQAHFSGEKLDTESGMSHLAHMASNLLVMMWHEIRQKGGK